MIFLACSLSQISKICNNFDETKTIFFGKCSKVTPLDVADFLYNVITRYGVAKIVMSDQGQEFVSRVNEELFKLCGTDHRISAVYHPHGLDEIMNQTLT